jgi:hypothetical protein
METNTYIFSGRVVPERALLDTSEFLFKAVASVDVPEGDLYIQIIKSQVAARFMCVGSVTNIFTLRNIVEDATRTLLDAVGYHRGYGYDLEIVQMIRPDSSEKRVFGIDVPVLVGACEQAGVTFQHIMVALGARDGAYLRHALADLREAIKSPKDTGFFCYRAVESLMNCVVARNGVSLDKAEGWELFRASYSIDREQVMAIKTFADPVRHGNLSQLYQVSDQDRSRLFTSAWQIVNRFIIAENQQTT